MLLRAPVLALLALGALPLLNVAATRFSRRIAPVGLALQQELGDLSGVVEESRRRHPRGEGLRRRAAADAARLEAEADGVLDRAMDAARLRAGFLPAARLPPDARRWWRSSGTAVTRCSTATSRSATSSPSTSTS